jgi:hypothetical protein
VSAPDSTSPQAAPPSTPTAELAVAASASPGGAGAVAPSPIVVAPPASGFDRAGMRALLADQKLAAALHRHVRAPFGHTVATLRALDAMTEALDLALAAGEAVQAALLEDLARSGNLALPEPTRDQRLFIGAFTLTVMVDVARGGLSGLSPAPGVSSDLELEGLEGLLEAQPRALLERMVGMAAKYLDMQAQRGGLASSPQLHEREAWTITTLHAFMAQLHAVMRLTHIGRLRPFGLALAQRKVSVGDTRYEGFTARRKADAAGDLKPVRIEDVVGNAEYLQAGLKLARDVAAYDLAGRRGAKQINPVLFGLGKPGCGKTITAHAIGHYFLEYCRARDIPARFRVIRRTDWASSYQNASAGELVRIFKEEVYGFPGVVGVYWPDIDTAFASRSSGDLRMEEKNNLGAVFGIFDGTLIPKDGKWFMICDANFMQMDEATRSRIAQNPFTVKGPESPEDFVRLMRDILLRNVESIANNLRTYVQDFEYPDSYFRASWEDRQRLIEQLSRRVSVDEVLGRIHDFVEFNREAEEKAEKDRFEREVEEMVRQLNAGRAATERAAKAIAEGR